MHLLKKIHQKNIPSRSQEFIWQQHDNHQSITHTASNGIIRFNQQNNRIFLYQIIVPKEYTKQGIGETLLLQMLHHAMQKEKVFCISFNVIPIDHHQKNTEQLIKWYQKTLGAKVIHTSEFKMPTMQKIFWEEMNVWEKMQWIISK